MGKSGWVKNNSKEELQCSIFAETGLNLLEGQISSWSLWAPCFPGKLSAWDWDREEQGWHRDATHPQCTKIPQTTPEHIKNATKKGQTAKARRFRTRGLLGALDPKHSCYSWKGPEERRLQKLAWWLGEEIKTAGIPYRTTWFPKQCSIIFVGIIYKIIGVFPVLQK